MTSVILLIANGVEVNVELRRVPCKGEVISFTAEPRSGNIRERHHPLAGKKYTVLSVEWPIKLFYNETHQPDTVGSSLPRVHLKRDRS